MGNAIRISGIVLAIVAGSAICACGARHIDGDSKTEGLEGFSVTTEEFEDVEVSTPGPSSWSPVTASPSQVYDFESSGPVRPMLPDYEPPTPPPACAVEGDVIYDVASEQELEARMTGRWVICSGEAFSGRPNQWFGNQHDGLEFGADGRWTALKYDSTGVLEPREGAPSGSWNVVTRAPGVYVLEFLNEFGGGNQGSFAFQASPVALRLGTMEAMNTYVAEAELTQDYGSVIAAQVPWQPERVPFNQAANAERCSQRGEFSALTSVEELEQRLTHRWIHCSGEGWYDRAHDGMEFRADGTWAFLSYDAAGELVPHKGFDGGGLWHSGENTGWFGVNMWSTRGESFDYPLFWTEPQAMRMRDDANYVVAD